MHGTVNIKIVNMADVITLHIAVSGREGVYWIKLAQNTDQQ